MISLTMLILRDYFVIFLFVKVVPLCINGFLSFILKSFGVFFSGYSCFARLGMISICMLSRFIGFQFDYVFDWTILKYQQSHNANAPPRALVSLEWTVALWSISLSNIFLIFRVLVLDLAMVWLLQFLRSTQVIFCLFFL